jgi:integrase
MNFDAREAKLLQPGQHLMVDGCPGLRLRASETRRTWTYRYKSPVDDKMRQVLIGHWPAMSLAAAVVAWEGLRERRDAGVDPAAAKREVRAAAKPKASDTYTVRDLCDDYLDGHVDQHRKPKGAKEMRRLMAAHLDTIADRAAVTITRTDAFNLLEGLQSIPVSAQTLRGELGAAWDYALDAGRIPDTTPNWWRLVMRGRLRSKGRPRNGVKIGTAKRALNDAEVAKLLRWLPNFSTLISDALTLYLWTATRGSETMSMMAGEISQEADGWWWTIPKAKTKNARHELATDLRVPLVGRALAIVQRRLEFPGPWLFPGLRGGHVNQATIGTQVYQRMPYSSQQQARGVPALTVTEWSPHDLRRTARTMLAAIGCPDAVGEAILGHMQGGIKGTYNRHSYDQERRHWLTQLDAKLEQLAALP